MFVSVILLCGGKGTRMEGPTPKQYLHLGDKPLALHSFDLFCQIPQVKEIIVVCEEEYRHLFASAIFASPGKRRQDSVLNGFLCRSPNADLICVHDSARPFITKEMFDRACTAAQEIGAATVGMPLKFTVKECKENGMVVQTPDRTHMWEIQTPQILKPEIMKKGFEKVSRENLTITDDVALAEWIGNPVKIVPGSYQNIKITTQEDLAFAASQFQNVTT